MRSEAQIKGALQDLDDAIHVGYELKIADRLANLEAFADVLRWVLEETQGLQTSDETQEAEQ